MLSPALGGMNRPSGLAAVTQLDVLKWGAAKMMKRKITVSLTATIRLLNRADSRMPITSSQVMQMITATAGALTIAPVADQAWWLASQISGDKANCVGM